jgi:hypothetical protein
VVVVAVHVDVAGKVSDGVAVNTSIAQRLEQAMGRAGRGAGDYCVVLLLGQSLVSWISYSRNLDRLTSGTRAQLAAGLEVSREIATARELGDTVGQCFDRDDGWVGYHAARLAEEVGMLEVAGEQIRRSAKEAKAYRYAVDGRFDKATRLMQELGDESGAEATSSAQRGWFMQLAARYALLAGDPENARGFQAAAYALNKSMHRPAAQPRYDVIAPPTSEAQTLAARLGQFRYRRGAVETFLRDVAPLRAPTSTASQYESGLERLGAWLGLGTDRPDSRYGVGPDVLWVLAGRRFVVLEAKNEKEPDKPFTKTEQGQLLNSVEWCRQQYGADAAVVPVSVHPCDWCEPNVVTTSVRVCTLAAIHALVERVEAMLERLADAISTGAEFEQVVDAAMQDARLVGDALVNDLAQHFRLRV